MPRIQGAKNEIDIFAFYPPERKELWDHQCELAVMCVPLFPKSYKRMEQIASQTEIKSSILQIQELTPQTPSRTMPRQEEPSYVQTNYYVGSIVLFQLLILCGEKKQARYGGDVSIARRGCTHAIRISDTNYCFHLSCILVQGAPGNVLVLFRSSEMTETLDRFYGTTGLQRGPFTIIRM